MGICTHENANFVLPDQEPFTPEERRTTLLAALLLPLRLAVLNAGTKKQTELASHIVLHAIKWKKRDAQAVVLLHSKAPELLSIYQALGVCAILWYTNMVGRS